MALWQKLWLLFAVIWIVVASLNVGTILAFSDEVEWQRALKPAAAGVLVPVVLYAILWLWNRFKKQKQ